MRALKSCRNFACLLLCLLLSACASSPTANFYTLSAVSPTDQLCQPESKELRIKTELLHFPEVLEQPQIATRPQPNRIDYAEFHRWAGSLENNFQQSLGENLEQFCRKVQVVPEFWPSTPGPDFQLSLDVVRFDGKLGDKVTLSVNWALKKTADSSSVERHSEIIEPVTDTGYAGLIAAQSRAVAKLAEEILQVLLAGS